MTTMYEDHEKALERQFGPGEGKGGHRRDEQVNAVPTTRDEYRNQMLRMNRGFASSTL